MFLFLLHSNAFCCIVGAKNKINPTILISTRSRKTVAQFKHTTLYKVELPRIRELYPDWRATAFVDGRSADCSSLQGLFKLRTVVCHDCAEGDFESCVREHNVR